MSETKIWIGIDVCQDWLDVSIRPSGVSGREANTALGIATLIQSWPTAGPVLVVVEASGGLERLLVAACHDAGIAVAIVNPRQVRDFAKGLGKAKTDQIDAAVLAHFGAVVAPSAQVPVATTAQTLSDWVRRRAQLVANQVAEKNRLSRAPATIRADIEEHLEQLKARIADLTEQIDALTQQQPNGPRKSTILLSVKGIGPITAALCLAELPELGQLSDKQIARLVGVAPMNHDSGKHRGKRMIQGGRTSVRCGLYMATWAAARHNPVIAAFYQRLMARGKCHKVALVACMRKLLVIINAMIRDDKTWESPV
jgi:transposase